MRAPETIHGVHVVAAPPILDGMWTDGGEVLRFATDEAFVIGGTAVIGDVSFAINELETGFMGWWLTPEELEAVAHHVEWALPQHRPALAQGLIAGVPARLWFGPDRTLLLCHRAYAHELIERVG